MCAPGWRRPARRSDGLGRFWRRGLWFRGVAQCLRPAPKAMSARSESGHEAATGKLTSLTGAYCRVPPEVIDTFGIGGSVQFLRVAAAYVVITALAAWTSAQGAEVHTAGAAQTNAKTARPSFDCTQATSAREKVICGDLALSALDGELGRLYRDKGALLSPEGAKLLQESERSWLHYIGIVCSSDDPDGKPWLSRKWCLTRRYNERVKQLQAAAQRVGPYVFNRIDVYAARPSGDETGSSTGFYIQHAAYPQIDNAKSPEARAWNKANVRDLPTEGDCGPGDYDVEYELGYANAHFVSVKWTDSTYCHGTAHGFGGVKTANTVLSFPLRSLRAKDLFGPGESWASSLKERFWTALIQSGWRAPENQPAIKQQLASDFIKPDRWLLTKDGLQVAFGSYEGGCYACTPRPITLPWSELKPLLSKSAIAP